MSDQGGDLVSLLTSAQRADLIHLTAATTEKMRAALRSAIAEEAKAPAPQLVQLQKAALESFDAWRDSVLTRVSEALNVPARSAAPRPAPPAPAGGDLEFLHTHYPPLSTPLASSSSSLPAGHAELVLQSLLLLLLSLGYYDARSRVLLVSIASSLNIPLSTVTALEHTTAGSLLAAAAAMSGDNEAASRAAASCSARRWKIGLASAAGAALIGVTGGLAAPLVAAQLVSVMGGLGLGATATAGYLGAVASSGAVVGALFGVYGGRMSGQAMERYAREVEDFSFLPLESGAELRVAVGVTGWIVGDPELAIVAPWRGVGGGGGGDGGMEAYALRWEVAALTDLGGALQTILASCALGWVQKEVIKRTVFATLYSALWPIGLLKAARVIDNPFSVARHRSDKAGRILADAIINKTQGGRPLTLLGFSLGARVVYSCLLTLADRGAFGLVENVVLMGAPVPADGDTWRRIRAVVAGRVVNVFSDRDYVLAFLYRTSSIQLGVAGLQDVAVSGVENVGLGQSVCGHLGYANAARRILAAVLQGDVHAEEAGENADFDGEDEADTELVAEKAERELEAEDPRK